jgi:hypothetical protein
MLIEFLIGLRPVLAKVKERNRAVADPRPDLPNLHYLRAQVPEVKHKHNLCE